MPPWVASFGRNITNQIRVVVGIGFTKLTGFINEPRTWGAQFKAVVERRARTLSPVFSRLHWMRSIPEETHG